MLAGYERRNDHKGSRTVSDEFNDFVFGTGVCESQYHCKLKHLTRLHSWRDLHLNRTIWGADYYYLPSNHARRHCGPHSLPHVASRQHPNKKRKPSLHRG